MPLILTVDSLHPEDLQLRKAAEVVRNGGVLVYPTETVYGIGSGPFQIEAMRRIHLLKQRSAPKPLLLLLGSTGDLRGLVRGVTREARRLMEEFWPGPLTLVFPAAPGLPDELTRGRGTIGIRIPSSPLCVRLIELTGTPLTSTSANLSGEEPLNSVGEMLSAFPPGIDCLLDAGPLPPSAPSTVVDVSGPVPVIVREGAISKEALITFLPASAR